MNWLYVFGFLFIISGCGFNVEVDNSPSDLVEEVLVVIPNYLITANPGPGIYAINPEVQIATTGFNKAMYCLSYSSECCTPDKLYTGKILVSTHASPASYDEGEFCLSFQGYGSNFKTAVQEYQYIIDNQSPSISARIYPLIGTNETRYMQTNQTHMFLRSTSRNFLDPSHYQTNLNIEDNNPASYSGCPDIYSNYNYLTYGMTSSNGDQETDASLFPFVTTPLGVPSGLNHYGENNLVSFMRYDDPIGGDKFACVTNKVILRDFPVFMQSHSGSYSTPVNGNNVLEFQGGVTFLGSFSGMATSSAAVNSAPYKLESNFVNIVN